MTSSPDILAELTQSIQSLYDAGLTPEQGRRLAELLEQNPDARRQYVRLTAFFESLKTCCATLPAAIGEEEDECAVVHGQPQTVARDEPAAAHSLFVPFMRSMVGNFSSDWPVAYLVATVVMAVGLLVGSVVHVSQPQQIAARVGWDKRSDVPPSQPTIIGRITGMVDCQWLENPKSEIRNPQQIINHKSEIQNPKSPVSLGDKFILSSGLLEITYDTGAKVILQGPVTYEVESKDGGFLSLGRLTARVERTKSEISKSPNLQTSKFVVRTPAAIVTDLGTEFGVEVSKEGNTLSHVFRGSVKVQVASSDGKAGAVAQVLHENQSARVDSRSAKRITVLGPSANPIGFVREIPKRTIRMLDLVDVVAGGDGFSGRRNAGIDVTTGRRVESLMLPSHENPNIILNGDGRYYRVKGLNFVDGVFIPDGSRGPLPTDSAGHTFAGFPPTANTTSNYLWAGGVIPAPVNEQSHRTATELGGIDYSSPGHGLLFMHANKAITFDLEAVRRANPDCKLLRFRAVAGDTEWIFQKDVLMYADLWVLVDGQVRFQRQKINGWKGAYWITLPIAEHDRYLTLAATDAGDGIGWDWIIFGDPQLDMVHRGPESQSASTKDP